MKTENKERFIAELGQEFPESQQSQDGSKTLVRFKAKFPRGCKPCGSEALVVFEGQGDPQLYVKDLPSLPNGNAPRSVSGVTIAGESWNQFSFSLTWDEDKFSAAQFVTGKLRRFALNE